MAILQTMPVIQLCKKEEDASDSAPEMSMFAMHAQQIIVLPGKCGLYTRQKERQNMEVHR